MYVGLGCTGRSFGLGAIRARSVNSRLGSGGLRRYREDVLEKGREIGMARENILIIDDEPDMRDALTAALRREGLCVSTAANGVEALEKVQGQSFDLIITDVRMPRMGGLALLQELKRTSAMIPVIMMTGYGRIEDAVEAMKAGVFDYLLKPFSLEDLKTVVMKALTPRNSPSSATVDASRHDEQEYPES